MYGTVVPFVVIQPTVGNTVVVAQVFRTVTVMTGTSTKSAMGFLIKTAPRELDAYFVIVSE